MAWYMEQELESANQLRQWKMLLLLWDTGKPMKQKMIMLLWKGHTGWSLQGKVLQESLFMSGSDWGKAGNSLPVWQKICWMKQKIAGWCLMLLTEIRQKMQWREKLPRRKNQHFKNYYRKNDTKSSTGWQKKVKKPKMRQSHRHKDLQKKQKMQSKWWRHKTKESLLR